MPLPVVPEGHTAGSWLSFGWALLCPPGFQAGCQTPVIEFFME